AGRKINDDMGKHIASNIIKTMIKAKQQIDGARVAVLGITFKENVGDVRNTKVIDIIEELRDYGVNVFVQDRKSTRLNSSHVSISYAVFCLIEKNKIKKY